MKPVSEGWPTMRDDGHERMASGETARSKSAFPTRRSMTYRTKSSILIVVILALCLCQREIFGGSIMYGLTAFASNKDATIAVNGFPVTIIGGKSFSGAINQYLKDGKNEVVVYFNNNSTTQPSAAQKLQLTIKLTATDLTARTKTTLIETESYQSYGQGEIRSHFTISGFPTKQLPWESMENSSDIAGDERKAITDQFLRLQSAYSARNWGGVLDLTESAGRRLAESTGLTFDSYRQKQVSTMNSLWNDMEVVLDEVKVEEISVQRIGALNLYQIKRASGSTPISGKGKKGSFNAEVYFSKVGDKWVIVGP